jgi:lysophospholipase L1-like esterase
VAGRFVAIGDSFTEGVGDWNPRFPNGVRGWADRVAKQLGRQDPEWEYANLAIRSKRLHHVRDEQVERALAMKPTLVSLYAGGNDILELRADMGELMREYEAMVARIAASGARPLLFTGFDIPLSPVLEPMKRRNRVFNDRVRTVARRYDAVLVDYWCFEEYSDPGLWDADRLHMSPAGHRNLAAHVLRILGVEHSLVPRVPERQGYAGLLSGLRRETAWLGEWVVPMFGRRLRNVTLGDHLLPRWPEPVRPADGLKRLARARAAESA